MTCDEFIAKVPGSIGLELISLVIAFLGRKSSAYVCSESGRAHQSTPGFQPTRFRHEQRKRTRWEYGRNQSDNCFRRKEGGGLNVYEAYVFHRWWSESLRAHQTNLELHTHLSKRRLQRLIRRRVKLRNTLPLQYLRNRSDVEVTGLKTSIQPLWIQRKRDRRARLGPQCKRRRNRLL